MKRIRGGARLSKDEDSTLEAADEPTLSAQVDVRAAFERANALGNRPLSDTADTSLETTTPGIPGAPFGEDSTMPGSSTLQMRPDKNPFQQAHTLPFITPVGVLPEQAQPEPRAAAAVVATPSSPEPSSPQPIESAPEVPFLQAFRDDDDEPYVPPGVGRRKMRGIVLGVLSVCFLLCGAAGLRQYLNDRAPPPAPPKAAAPPTPTPTPAPSPVETASVATPAPSSPSPIAPPSASAVASSPASAPASAPSVVAPPPVAPPPPASTVHHAIPPPTAAPHAAKPHVPPPAAAPPPKPPAPAKGGINRNNPF